MGKPLGITAGMAERIASTRLDDLPENVIAYSETLAMSALGAMAAGHRCTGGDRIIRYLERCGGTPVTVPHRGPLRHFRRPYVPATHHCQPQISAATSMSGSINRLPRCKKYSSQRSQN